MPTRYKVVLQGFSEFERNALTFCLKLTAEREPAYEPVPRLAQTDFVIADADQAGVIDTVADAGLTPVTVFVGRQAPANARAHVTRPIDPTLIVRELDQLLAAGTGDDDAQDPDDLFAPTQFHPEEADDDEPPTVPSRLEDFLPSAAFEQPPLLVPEPPPDAPAQPPAIVDERAAAKAAARAAARRARLAAAAPQVAPTHPPDALVLDDSEIAQVFLCRLLSDFGFRPHPVQSGAEALDLLAQQSFTVAFLDVQLEAQDEHDGIDLCHAIKHDPISPDGSVPVVVVVSGQARPADRVRAGLAGCDVFLTKPISRGDVARALESCGVALPSDARRRR